MWDYIVLGQIPGTSVQVTFEMWLIIISAFVAVISGLGLVHYGRTSRLLLALRIGYILQTAAYSQWLLTRRHIRA